jgi:hypothetical protein
MEGYMGERSVMRHPIEDLLARYGIKYKTSVKGQKTWFNLDRCPVCNHTGYQCGVYEMAGDDGKLVHGFKCQHTDVWRYQEFLE